MNYKAHKRLVEQVKTIQLVDDEFTHVGEYIYTKAYSKYPVCSLWEYTKLLKLPHAKAVLANPILIQELKSLVQDLRGVQWYDSSL